MKSIRIGEEKYPSLLEKIKNPPKKLYIEGDEKVLEMPCVTVIGSRNMTDYGRNVTREIVKELVMAGICIVSGLAIGIDSIGHRTALNNDSKTIAVIGSGLDNIYPSKNINLADKIIENGGLIMSEYIVGTKPLKQNFPRRKRIISGLSDPVIVVEGSKRSGTLITAKFIFLLG